MQLITVLMTDLQLHFMLHAKKWKTLCVKQNSLYHQTTTGESKFVMIWRTMQFIFLTNRRSKT